MDVLLISMPFGPISSPSLGLSLLKQSLGTEYDVTIRYFLIEFAKTIGVRTYSEISTGYPLNHDLVGEWIFSSVFFNQSDNDIEKYVNEIIKGNNSYHSKKKFTSDTLNKTFVARVLSARKKVKKFIENCVIQVQMLNPKIIGFTSVFQQQTASLFLASEIRKKNPDVVIVFGGANNEGAMGIEYLKKFPFIDAIISGEGDIIFKELVERILSGEQYSHLKGVICKGNLDTFANKTHGVNAQSVQNMDSLPFVNYDDYFEQLKENNIDHLVHPRILFESSRGCWWGEKMHCTFCGLNGETMKHRSKSAKRVMEELNHLHLKYPDNPISIVDNILDMEYFKTLIPELVKNSNEKMELFYEVKANLTQEQVHLLKLAGITTIQPGIESLNDNVLKLMRKGVKAMQNIQLLKWCKEYGISAEWNILWGFPGESSDDYNSMSEIIPLISHFKPPHGASPIRLDRFSPNFNTPTLLGFKDLMPYPSYKFIFPFENKLENIAYYFIYDYIVPQNVESYTMNFSVQIDKWKKQAAGSDFFFVDKKDFLLLWDFREIAANNLIVLKGSERNIYLNCSKMNTAMNLYSIFSKNNDEIGISEINDTLLRFTQNKLMISDGIHYLSLAIPLNEYYSPNSTILKKLYKYVKKVGKYSKSDDLIKINLS